MNEGILFTKIATWRVFAVRPVISPDSTYEGEEDYSLNGWLLYRYGLLPTNSKTAPAALPGRMTHAAHDRLNAHMEAVDVTVRRCSWRNMYGPPSECKKNSIGREAVCENVFGL